MSYCADSTRQLTGVWIILLLILAVLLAHVIRHWNARPGRNPRGRRDYAGTASLHTSLSPRATARRPASRQPRRDRLAPGFGLPPDDGNAP